MPSILSASLFVSIALLLSRISGIVREILIASRLGTSETADGTILLLTLPDFMVALLLAGGLNAALVPTLKRLKGPARTNLLFTISVLALIVFLAISIILMSAMKPILANLAPNFDFASNQNFEIAFAFCALTLPIAALVGISGSHLNVTGRFVVPGLAVFAFNIIVSLFVALKTVDNFFLFSFGLAVFLASLIRLTIHLFSMRQVFKNRFKRLLLPRGFITSLAQGTLAFGIIVAIPLIYRSLYARGGDGFLTVFNYSHKLFELPAALLVAPIAVVLLPKMSALAKSNDPQIDSYLKNGLFAVFALSSVALTVGFVFMDEIVQIVFGYGQITVEDRIQIAVSCRILLLALPFHGLIQISSIALNAKFQNGTLLALSAISALVSVGCYYSLESLFASAYAAQLSFVVFSLSLALLLVWRTAFSTVCNTGSVVWLISIIIRIGLAILPVAFIKGFSAIDNSLYAVTMMTFFTLICLGAITPELRMLNRMRTDTN